VEYNLFVGLALKVFSEGFDGKGLFEEDFLLIYKLVYKKGWICWITVVGREDIRFNW